ncbi:MAG: AMP-binding protein, partial [Gammaproteobacteria bacterium]|nr:AMP-binding protein [Gammaproteobacteria bacterium]
MSNVLFPGQTSGKDNIALVDGNHQMTYGELQTRVDQLATGLLAGREDLNEERIAILIPASPDYVIALHGIWRAGGIALPLGIASSAAELEYYLSSAGVTRLIAKHPHPDAVVKICALMNITLLSVTEVLTGAEPLSQHSVAAALPEVALHRRAMILFTSGTTGKPKGVVTTHNAILAQIKTLVNAWAWCDHDVIPLFLPLHHVHGIINILSCALWCGATVHLMPKLDIAGLCARVAARSYSLFMAVPTVYVKLIRHIADLDSAKKTAVCDGFASMRLTVSGSAACPVNVFTQWEKLTGQVLLERYGMTEVGMALANPYDGERRAGYVGQPLPGVTVQLFNDNDTPVDTASTPGEIRIKSDQVFLEYWHDATATRECFRDGWFCTGDIAVIENGYFRIMGRAAVD